MAHEHIDRSKGKSPYVRRHKRPYDYSHIFDSAENERWRNPGRFTADTPLGRAAWAFTKAHGSGAKIAA